MSHMPINHHLRSFYRAAAALTGLYVLIFGVVGIVRSAGKPLFYRGPETVLGLRSNLAFAIISTAAGIVVLGGAIVGRNLDRFINLWGGVLFTVAGLLMLALLQTSANFLNFTLATCVASFVIGIVMFAAGLYGRVGAPEEEAREEHFRCHHGPDPHSHSWSFKGAPKRPTESHPDGHRFA